MQGPSKGPATAETDIGANSRDLNFTDALLRGEEPASPQPQYSQYDGQWAVDMLTKMGWAAGDPVGQDHGHARLTEPIPVVFRAKQNMSGIWFSAGSSSAAARWMKEPSVPDHDTGGMSPGAAVDAARAGSAGAVGATSGSAAVGASSGSGAGVPEIANVPDDATGGMAAGMVVDSGSASIGVAGGMTPGCPPGYVWPPPKGWRGQFIAQDTQAMGKAGIRFLKEHCFFCPREHEAPLDASVLLALFESHCLA